MFLLICKWVIISLTLIFLFHHLYMFLMNTLTVPKIKDLVNKPTEQYRDIYEILERPAGGANTSSETNTMTEELSSFLNELKKNPQSVSQIQSASQIQSLGQIQSASQIQSFGQTQSLGQIQSLGPTQGTASNDFMAANEMLGGFSQF